MNKELPSKSDIYNRLFDSDVQYLQTGMRDIWIKANQMMSEYSGDELATLDEQLKERCATQGVPRMSLDEYFEFKARVSLCINK